MLPDFNRSERKALLLGTALVLAGAAARLGLGPDEATWAWMPAGPGSTEDAALAGVRDAVADSRDRAARIATPLAADESLDPNRAPDVELQRLRGVGPVLARAIVEHRRTTPFRTKADLLEVKGIGPATLRRIAPHLDLPGASRDAPSGGPGPGRDAARPAGPSPRVPAPDGRVDLNRAGRPELEALPGVGPVLAERILEHRSLRGRFDSLEQLLEVRGIGPARLDDLRSRAAVR
jgi:competence protein ComEA